MVLRSALPARRGCRGRQACSPALERDEIRLGPRRRTIFRRMPRTQAARGLRAGVHSTLHGVVFAILYLDPPEPRDREARSACHQIGRNQPPPSSFSPHENSRRKLQHVPARRRHGVHRGDCRQLQSGGADRQGPGPDRRARRAGSGRRSPTSPRFAWSAHRSYPIPIRANDRRLPAPWVAVTGSSRYPGMCTPACIMCHTFVTSCAKPTLSPSKSRAALASRKAICWCYLG